ncbi:DUF6308 family protein [Arthrobacter sp. KNU40]|uniref:DUF6308 family protein n=1 Tax=Arthrobacter sp. KNU40 TaxID=3447965 RepID=UPI003F63C7D1
MDILTVGGLTVDLAQAKTWAREYLVESPGRSSYPAYDAYEGSGRDNHELGDADLLAPALLNVSQNPIPTYYALKRLMPVLNESFRAIPTGLPLQDAEDSQLDAIARLFRVLDDPAPKQIGMTTLSKVLARKRPGLIPVYDSAVAHCYSGSDNAPVPWQPGRSWEDYARAWLKAVQDDLRGQLEAWQELARIAPADDVGISPLRALDIVSWRAGLPAVSRRRGRRAMEAAEPE